MQIEIPSSLSFLLLGYFPLPKSPSPGDEVEAAARVLWGEHRGGPRTRTRNPVRSTRGGSQLGEHPVELGAVGGTGPT